MFHFGSREKSSVYGVLLDIDSGSIGTAIVESSTTSEKPTIVYAQRTALRAPGEKSKDPRRAREAILAAALTLSQEGLAALRAHNPHGKITRMLATVSAPWSHTIARTVSYESEEPFKITKSLLRDLTESAESEIMSHLSADEAVRESGFEIIERATTDIAVNEYLVENPIRQTGTVCSLSHMAGLIPTEIRSAIDEVHTKLFPSATCAIHTHMLALYCVLRDLFPKKENLCIVNVTGEATEFGIVEHNLLSETIYTTEGSSTLVRTLMEQTGSPQSDVETCIAATDCNHLKDTNALKQQTETYQTALTGVLDTLFTHRALPKDMAIIAPEQFASFFRDHISTTVSTVLRQEPRILSITPEELADIGTTTPDTYLLLIARFFHKLHGCGELESL